MYSGKRKGKDKGLNIGECLGLGGLGWFKVGFVLKGVYLIWHVLYF